MKEKLRFCKACGEPIPQSTTGRAKETCSSACKQKFYRAMQKASIHRNRLEKILNQLKMLRADELDRVIVAANQQKKILSYWKIS